MLYDRFLGPPTDIVDFHEEFVAWRTVREETFRLLRSGRRAEAVARIRPDGVGGAHVKAMMAHLRQVDDFARNKGDELYRSAMGLKRDLYRQLVAIAAVILLLAAAVSALLLTGIKGPLEHLTEVARQFRQGRRDVRSRHSGANEIGVLSAAFDALADTVEDQMRLSERAGMLADVMLREIEARPFCRALLRALAEYTGSQVGAVYLLNPPKTEFDLFESIGLDGGGRATFSAASPEGEFGAALASGRMRHITDIPDDTPFTFSAAAGDFRPREIVTLPLLAGQEAVAVVSLASLRSYGADDVRLLEQILGTLTARMNGVLAYRRAQELAELLDEQNRELATQAREVAAQADELTQHNTELELQKRRLDETNRLKSAFLSNMSHELRTPLNSVIALSGVLSRRLSGAIPEEEYGYLDVIERNGRHLLALINDILDLSRIEAGRVDVQLVRVSLRELVGELVEMLRPQADKKKVALLNRVPDDLPRLISDPDKCRHVLQNLIGNAVKFTDHGSVEVAARQMGSELHVVVMDTGIGIAADQLTHIFEEFRQADGSASRKYGGTGLGLAIAKRYAEILGGGIAVESATGRGSTFTLRLPFTPARLDEGPMPAEESTAQSGRHGSHAGAGRRILLVEDSEPAVIQMTDILAGQGYEVVVARSGRQALARIEAAAPDAAILDLMMPEMDGFEVLRAIRAMTHARLLPVLILTARHVTREELSFLRGNHIHQLIQKGDVSKAELLDAVSRMVGPATDELKPAPTPKARPSRGRPVVLVVEDNPDNLRTMRALLRDAYAVLEATDGQAGVEQARRHRPDVILMDLALPVMDGFAALAAIREDETLRHTPVLAVTASAMKGDREEVLARGFDGYLSKPIDETQLRRALGEALHENQ